MTPTPSTRPTRHRPRTRVAAGLFAGLALATGVALAVPAGASTAPRAAVRSEAVAQPSALATPRRVPARASRGGARTAPVRYVNRTVVVGQSFSGNASWYGGSFQGRSTANGERFDTNDLTAASKTLPFGTRLRVCRRSRCVVVRINDRGPYVRGRVLDLSRAAAEAIGDSGVEYVTATPVGTRRVAVPPPVAKPAPVVTAAVVAAPVPLALKPVVLQPVVLAAEQSPASRPSVLVLGGLAVLAGVGFLRELRRS